MLVAVFDGLVPGMTWAVGSGKENGPRPGWRLRTGEGRLLRGCPGLYVGVHVMNLLSPHSRGALDGSCWAGVSNGLRAAYIHFATLTGGWTSGTALLMNKRAMPLSYLNLPRRLLTVHSHDIRVGVLQCYLPLHQPVAEPHSSSSSLEPLYSLSWTAAPGPMFLLPEPLL